MDSILVRTHAKENIDCLRARDYYFDLAKKLHACKTALAVANPVLLILSYIPILQSRLGYTDFSRDVFIGILTLMTMAASFLIFDPIIARYTGISNMLRDHYDRVVLDIPGPCFIHDSTQIKRYLQKADKGPLRPNYAYWYGEIFSSHKNSNIFCCQLDNIFYSYYAYAYTGRILSFIMIIFWVIALGMLATLVLTGNLWVALFIAFSLAECFEIIHNEISKVKETTAHCGQIIADTEKIGREQLTDECILAMQHAVDENRSFCIFLPQPIRNRFLKSEGNKYKEALNAVKEKLWGEDAILPEKDTQIDLVSEDGQWCVPMSELHAHLRKMLEQVIAVFDAEGIDYTLDGGTLIGAMRASTQGFVPWDDDVDLLIPADQIEKAKDALRKHLQFPIQDAESERYYAPYLASFRIREDNCHSTIDDRENPFGFKQKDRGIFLDVYTYSPILKTLFLDKLYRRLLIHPLNKKMRNLQVRYKSAKKLARDEKKFLRLKDRYLRRLSFYKRHAKNRRYWAYSPEYVHDYAVPGPYFSYETVFGKKALNPWEGMQCRIPTNHTSILEGYYGKDWETSPYPSQQALWVEFKENWYSNAKDGITAQKHIANLVFVDDTYTKRELPQATCMVELDDRRKN